MCSEIIRVIKSCTCKTRGGTTQPRDPLLMRFLDTFSIQFPIDQLYLITCSRRRGDIAVSNATLKSYILDWIESQQFANKLNNYILKVHVIILEFTNHINFWNDYVTGCRTSSDVKQQNYRSDHFQIWTENYCIPRVLQRLSLDNVWFVFPHVFYTDLSLSMLKGDTGGWVSGALMSLNKLKFESLSTLQVFCLGLHRPGFSVNLIHLDLAKIEAAFVFSRASVTAD